MGYWKDLAIDIETGHTKKYLCRVQFVRNYCKSGEVEIEVDARSEEEAEILALHGDKAESIIEKAVESASLKTWEEDDVDQVASLTIVKG